jgi:hypothetical protein
MEASNHEILHFGLHPFNRDAIKGTSKNPIKMEAGKGMKRYRGDNFSVSRSPVYRLL